VSPVLPLARELSWQLRTSVDKDVSAVTYDGDEMKLRLQRKVVDRWLMNDIHGTKELRHRRLHRDMRTVFPACNLAHSFVKTKRFYKWFPNWFSVKVGLSQSYIKPSENLSTRIQVRPNSDNLSLISKANIPNLCFSAKLTPLFPIICFQKMRLSSFVQLLIICSL
jgi:hypothetical protein